MRLVDAFAASESVVAVMRAADGVFLAVNDAFELSTGYRRDQVIGQLPVQVGLWPEPNFRARLWSLLRADRRIRALPMRLACADGRIVPGQLTVEYATEDGVPVLFCLLTLLPDQTAVEGPGPDNALYRSLYLAASEGIYRSLPGGGFLDVNPAMARLLGYDSPRQLLDELARDTDHLYADPGQAEAARRQLLSGGRVERQRARVHRRDGRIIWVSENARAIRDAGGAVRFFEGSLVDITSQVEAEQALRQSQALYQVLVENSRDGVFLIQRGRIVFANGAMERILGYGAGELQGGEYMALVDPVDRDAQAGRRAEREAGSRSAQVYEIHLRRKSGERILCEVRADAVEYQGDIASTGTLRDVTEDRRRQRAIAEAERRYRELFESSPAGLFRTSLDGRIMEVNPVMAGILGYDSPEQLKAMVADMGDVYVDPGEREGLVARAVRDGAFSHHETRVRTRGGGQKWVSASVLLIRDEAGNPVHFTGSVLDIDEHHAMQQALQRSEGKYRTLVEHSQVGVFIMRDEVYTYANQALSTMLGLDDGALEGRNYREIMAPESVAQSELRDRQRREGQAVTPDFETSPAGPFDRWPTGHGFEYFYGFMGGETNNWDPPLIENTLPIEKPEGDDNYHLSSAMADKAIAWISSQKASAPDKPFFAYWAPGAAHAPHHSPKDYADKYKGQFDQGWDKVREETLARQIKLGVVPEGTQLTPRPDSMPAWDDCSADEKKLYARMQEVFAGFLEHVDAQLGRVVEALEMMGLRDDTLIIYVVGDNGPSAEGTLTGTVNNMKSQHGYPDDVQEMLKVIDEIGNTEHENHYPVSWCWAGSSPFQWCKQVASHFGGTRNGMVMSWPSRIADQGGLRSQFHHAIDIVPTILEAAGVTEPISINGVPQKPIEGVSMAYSWGDAAAPSTRQTQYFEMFGNRALYHNGWVAGARHGKLPWQTSGSSPDFDSDTWELYNIDEDFSQANDLAEKEPAKLRELQDMFWGAYYGSCTDKFGIRWMFNCAEKK